MVKKALWLVLLVGALVLVGQCCVRVSLRKKSSSMASMPIFLLLLLWIKPAKPDGFDVAVVDWIAKDKGFKVEHKPMDWDGIIPSLNTKKIDMIASGMSITDARKEQVNFSLPYWEIIQVLVAKAEPNLTPEAAMKDGNKIGVQTRNHGSQVD